MIKLKQIINEIEKDRTVMWKTPDNTPDAVINMLHRIMASVMKTQGLGKKPTEYITLQNKIEGDWMIWNPKNKSKWLFYNDEEDMWWVLQPDGSSIYPIESEQQLEQLINSWAK